MSTLVVGTSGGGKSTVAAASSSGCGAKGYNFCIIDPEGDYDSVESAVVLGGPEHAPTVDECVQLLGKPDQNAVINLLGVKLNDRPWFFLSLFARIRELRARTGRPHWLIVDEAHHAMPANWRPTDQTLPERLEGVAGGERLAETASRLRCCARSTRSSCSATSRARCCASSPRRIACAVPERRGQASEAGTALLWNKQRRASRRSLVLEPSRTERRRHLRKYAEGELPRGSQLLFPRARRES